MEPIAGDSDASQGGAMEVDATDANILQSDITESDTNYTQADAFNDTFERDISDEVTLESVSQGNKLSSAQN